jgi:DNA repair protein RadC
MAITDWPEDERPRERLARQGAGALSDAELLAIFLRVGIRGKSAVDLARDLLAHFDGRLARLCNASIAELATVKGMGNAKATQLLATVELARRAIDQQLQAGDVLATPSAVRDYLRLTLGALPHEAFLILFLDAQNRLIACEELFRGSLSEAAVYPREVVKRALANNAAAIIAAHNHPSGSPEPSAADRTLTATLKQALALIDVRLLDHFVVAGGLPPTSLAERGWL